MNNLWFYRVGDFEDPTRPVRYVALIEGDGKRIWFDKETLIEIYIVIHKCTNKIDWIKVEKGLRDAGRYEDDIDFETGAIRDLNSIQS